MMKTDLKIKKKILECHSFVICEILKLRFIGYLKFYLWTRFKKGMKALNPYLYN